MSADDRKVPLVQAPHEVIRNTQSQQPDESPKMSRRRSVDWQIDDDQIYEEHQENITKQSDTTEKHAGSLSSIRKILTNLSNSNSKINLKPQKSHADLTEFGDTSYDMNSMALEKSSLDDPITPVKHSKRDAFRNLFSRSSKKKKAEKSLDPKSLTGCPESAIDLSNLEQYEASANEDDINVCSKKQTENMVYPSELLKRYEAERAYDIEGLKEQLLSTSHGLGSELSVTNRENSVTSSSNERVGYVGSPYFSSYQINDSIPLSTVTSKITKNQACFNNFFEIMNLNGDLKQKYQSHYENGSVELEELSKDILNWIKELVSREKETKKENSSMKREVFDQGNKLIALNDTIAEQKRHIEELTSDVTQLHDGIQKGKYNETSDNSESKDNTLDRLTEINDHAEQKLKEYKKALRHVKLKYDELLKENDNNKHIAERVTIQYECLKEKFDHMIEKISSAIQGSSDLQRDSRASEIRVHELESSLQEQTTKITYLQGTNAIISEQYRKEHTKVQRLKREKVFWERYIEYIDAYRTESLQFMSEFMMAFKGTVSKQNLYDYDYHLKLLHRQVPLYLEYKTYDDKRFISQTMEENLNQNHEELVTFYKTIAKDQFLNEVVHKHVSYLRTNTFLSEQLHQLKGTDNMIGIDDQNSSRLEERNALKPRNINRLSLKANKSCVK